MQLGVESFHYNKSLLSTTGRKSITLGELLALKQDGILENDFDIKHQCKWLDFLRNIARDDNCLTSNIKLFKENVKEKFERTDFDDSLLKRNLSMIEITDLFSKKVHLKDDLEKNVCSSQKDFYNKWQGKKTFNETLSSRPTSFSDLMIKKNIISDVENNNQRSSDVLDYLQNKLPDDYDGLNKVKNLGTYDKSVIHLIKTSENKSSYDDLFKKKSFQTEDFNSLVKLKNFLSNSYHDSYQKHIPSTKAASLNLQDTPGCVNKGNLTFIAKKNEFLNTRENNLINNQTCYLGETREKTSLIYNSNRNSRSSNSVNTYPGKNKKLTRNVDLSFQENKNVTLGKTKQLKKNSEAQNKIKNSEKLSSKLVYTSNGRPNLKPSVQQPKNSNKILRNGHNTQEKSNTEKIKSKYTLKSCLKICFEKNETKINNDLEKLHPKICENNNAKIATSFISCLKNESNILNGKNSKNENFFINNNDTRDNGNIIMSENSSCNNSAVKDIGLLVGQNNELLDCSERTYNERTWEIEKKTKKDIFENITKFDQTPRKKRLSCPNTHYLNFVEENNLFLKKNDDFYSNSLLTEKPNEFEEKVSILNTFPKKFVKREQATNNELNNNNNNTQELTNFLIPVKKNENDLTSPTIYEQYMCTGGDYQIHLLEKCDDNSECKFEWYSGFHMPLGAQGRQVLMRKLRKTYHNNPIEAEKKLMEKGIQFNRLPYATVVELFEMSFLLGCFNFAIKCCLYLGASNKRGIRNKRRASNANVNNF